MLQDVNTINYNTIKKIILADKKNSIVIFDFDYTITTLDSETSIGVFTKYLPVKYKIKKKKLDLLTKKAKSKILYYIIWKRKLKLLLKYYDENILNSINYLKEFKINSSIKKIIMNLNKNKIPIIIYSSGITEVIQNVLIKNEIYSDNIKIIANSMNNSTKIITPKKRKIRNINYKNIYVFGDKIDDLKIINNSMNILVTSNKMKRYYR